MKLSTLCYLEKNDQYLMLHRTKKKRDPSAGKWIGVGGKFEGDESPEECLCREVFEETGYELKRFRFRGIVTFVSDQWETEYMHLFTADKFTGELIECSEGELSWVNKYKLDELCLWEGDRIFLKLLSERDQFFSLKLVYCGERLIEVRLDGEVLQI